MGPMKMIARLSSGRWAGTVGNVACACVTIPMARRCRSTSMATPRRRLLVTLMNGKATTESSALTEQFVTARKNGREMMMADGVREVHVNTIEGLWTTARNFLRPFRGVHKKCLKYYLAMCEHKINLKRINPKFISQLVAEHRLVT